VDKLPPLGGLVRMESHRRLMTMGPIYNNRLAFNTGDATAAESDEKEGVS